MKVIKINEMVDCVRCVEAKSHRALSRTIWERPVFDGVERQAFCGKGSMGSMLRLLQPPPPTNQPPVKSAARIPSDSSSQLQEPLC